MKIFSSTQVALFSVSLFASLAAPAASFKPLAGQMQLNQPLFMVTEPLAVKNERAFWVIEKDGKVQRMQIEDGKAVTREILDMSGVTGFTSSGEQGLLGMAVDSDFSKSPYVYFYQSHEMEKKSEGLFERPQSEQASLIVRYQWNAQSRKFDGASRKVLFVVPQEPYSNHKGGMIAFGPDGKLYIATGDGGAGGDPHNNSQNKGNLLGKILRISVVDGEVSVPADNPFSGQANQRAEIWAYGLRNPWRFSFDRATGDLWAGDVGQGNFEEINLVVRGGNYGWRLKEGQANYNNPENRTPENYQAPVWAYGRREGYSVTGGYVYRGAKHKALQGAYLFGDYGSGKVWTLRRNNSATPQLAVIGEVFGLVSFAEDSVGEMYALSIQGEILELR